MNKLESRGMDSKEHLYSSGGSGRAIAFLAEHLRTHTLPAFLIIGAQKAGTTSLASYLAAHPSVISPRFKEVHFFDLNYSRGVHWYRLHFAIGARRRLKTYLHGQRLLACDATPYYIFHPQAASRASRLIPSARIIILLRDPVDRAYSHYNHEVRLGNENLSFEEAVQAEPSRIAGEVERFENEPFYESFNYQHFTYLRRGCYSDQILQWLKYFGSHQLLVLSSERFFESPRVEYRKVLKFLGLPAWELASYPAEHVGKYHPMSQAIRDRLKEYYASQNQALRNTLNSYWPGTGDAVVDRFAA